MSALARVPRPPLGPARRSLGALRLGLCCQFVDQPIRFRTTTATALARLAPDARARRVAEICQQNAEALHGALQYCARHGIGAFRVNSQILPAQTHPEVGYDVADLPAGETIIAAFRRCGDLARRRGIRLTFHPDQYVVLNSPRREVVERALADLEAHAELAEWLGADVITIHGGGAYGDRRNALAALALNIDRLSAQARRRLTLENDDRVFTPSDLLPVCRDVGVPLVYDVHHHRCLADGLSIDEATAAARATWNREPVFHISSPLSGWDGPSPERHHDYVDAADFPACWLGAPLTVEVEAKAKELAVLRLAEFLRGRSTEAIG